MVVNKKTGRFCSGYVHGLEEDLEINLIASEDWSD
jgi:hypothetical protein